PLVASFVDESRRQARRQAWRVRGLVAAGVAAAGVAVVAYVLIQWVRQERAVEAARASLISLPGGGAVEVHEVTNAQYRRCVTWKHCGIPSATGGRPPHFVHSTPDAPLVNVDATQARSFCSWIGRRLPTFAELRAADASPRVQHLLTNPGG